MGSFQLPLSGSLAKAAAENSMEFEFDFQLPLSGSHPILDWDDNMVEDFILSTPSLGITSQSRASRRRHHRARFQLPLSGSRPQSPITRAAPASRFQLPLSGSPTRKMVPAYRHMAGLSTPSLGITSTAEKHLALGTQGTFNSLSRDHRGITK